MGTIFTWISVVLLFIVFILAIYVIYMSSQHGVFKKLGIPGPSPVPVFGNYYQLMKMGIISYYVDFYQKYKDSKVYGHFEGRSPTLVIRDLDMIRDICVKHFTNFTNRRTLHFSPPMDNMLNMIKDDHWRNVRATMSPTFSTGKLRRMLHHVIRSSEQLKLNLRDKERRGEMVDLKHVMSCYTIDAIAAAGFGVQIDSLKDQENEFVLAAGSIMKSFMMVFLTTFLLPFMTPSRLNALGINPTPKSAIDFFKRFVDETFAGRKEEMGRSKRTDFLQLMVEASERTEDDDEDNDNTTEEESRELKMSSGRKPLSPQDIQAQGLIFVLAGFDTTSTALSYAMFLLANHPDCCRRLQQEIDDVLGTETPNYENLQKLTYMEMCLNETIRLYPPGIIFDRVCKEDIVIGDIRIPQGMTVQFPVYAIHRDPEIWKDPDTFDPERFNADNKMSRHPYAFTPFGHGPRSCVGNRLALLELKIGLAAILQEMTPVVCPKTVYPPRPTDIIVTPADGLWVKLERRE